MVVNVSYGSFLIKEIKDGFSIQRDKNNEIPFNGIHWWDKDSIITLLEKKKDYILECESKSQNIMN